LKYVYVKLTNSKNDRPFYVRTDLITQIMEAEDLKVVYISLDLKNDRNVVGVTESIDNVFKIISEANHKED